MDRLKVRLTKQARTDLQQIRAYYLSAHPSPADRGRLAINAAIALLCRRPGLGVPSADTPGVQSKLLSEAGRTEFTIESVAIH